MLFLYALAVVAVGTAAGCNAPRQGCFKHRDRVEHILWSDHKTAKLTWGNMQKYIKEAVCRCEKSASSKGYAYFSMRNFAECHGIKTLTGLQSSIYCFHHSDKMCQDHHKECVGADEGEFIYKVTIAYTQPEAVCKGMAGYYYHHTMIKLSHGKQVSGRIGGRPEFKGLIQHPTTTSCKGYVDFPDDRRYAFDYDTTTCTIHWDGRRNANLWKNVKCDAIDVKTDACQEMSSQYFANTPLKVSSDRSISGHINRRPGFKGKVTLATTTECRGWVNFPDDRTYHFEYERNTCTIHWDGKRTTNKWKKAECLYCEGISGYYAQNMPFQVYANGHVSGHIGRRPAFKGKVTKANGNECKGYVDFPDDRRYTFDFDKSTCTIHWDGRTNNNLWVNAKCAHLDVATDACSDMSANYWSHVPLRVSSGRQITGHIGGRPNFKGMITFATKNECRGWVNFPDDRTYHFQYERNVCTIHWDGKRSTNKWRNSKCPRRG